LLVMANRDERLDRMADAPGAWWAEQPDVVGGRDRTGGGTWLAVRRDGMMAAVLNRADSLGPAAGYGSRGALPLLALRHPCPAAAAKAIAGGGGRYRAFNLVVADRGGAWFVRGGADGAREAVELSAGLHMITARDPDDVGSPRTARHLPRLRAVAAPEPPDWAGWHSVLANRSGPAVSQINIAPIGGFGTVSAARIGVPAAGVALFDHAAGAPDRAPFVAVG
jgi:hypothetical protein